MANIFAILTALVLAVSGYLAYANMGDDISTPPRGYKGWIKQRQDEQASLGRNQAALAKVQENLNNTETELADFEGKNKTLQVEVDAQLEKNMELTAKSEAKKAESESKAAEVAEKEEATKGIGDPEEIIAKLKRTQEQLALLDASIGGGTAKRAGLESEKASTQVSIDGLKGQINLRVSGKSDPALRTYVRNVYPGLGFVTIAGGDNKGIVKGSTLDVIRDGEVIGKLQVTTVEATTSAADIVPSQLIGGGSLVAGDILVAEKAN